MLDFSGLKQEASHQAVKRNHSVPRRRKKQEAGEGPGLVEQLHLKMDGRPHIIWQ